MLRKPLRCKHEDDLHDVQPDGQQIGIESIEPMISHCQYHVWLHCPLRNKSKETDEVEEPPVIVKKEAYNHFQRQGLHTAFRGIVSENSVDYDLLLPLREPPFGMQLISRLNRRRYHHVKDQKPMRKVPAPSNMKSHFQAVNPPMPLIPRDASKEVATWVRANEVQK